MKTYILILFIAVHCSLFAMKRGPEDTRNFDFALLVPIDIQEKIVYILLSEEDNPLFRSVIVGLVCKKWANIVDIEMNKEGRINTLLKTAEKENKDYLFMFIKARKNKVKMTGPASFVESSSFNVRYKYSVAKGYAYIMSHIIKEKNEGLFLKAINREHACLNEESIQVLIHQPVHNCILDDNGMCSKHEYFTKESIILNCLINNKPAIFLKCKYDFFYQLTYSGYSDFCIFKMIAPYLEVHNSGNISYYLNVMIEKQKKFLEESKFRSLPPFAKIIPFVNSEDYRKEVAAGMDERHYYYLSVLIKEGANILVPTKSSNGEMVPLAATLIKEIDSNFFPKVNQLLEGSIKVQRFLKNSLNIKNAND